jgi:antitoxin component YwqK of YwqJK toxin-antitoxin module
MSKVTKCKAITKKGTKCTRDAVINGLCTQHYNMFINEEEKIYKLIEQILPPAITESILSEYIEFDELEELLSEFEGLKINPNRIKVEKTYYEDGKIDTKSIYIDRELRIIEKWNNGGTISYITEYKNSMKNRTIWYTNGYIYSEENYHDNKKQGNQYEWHPNGNLESEEFYKDDKLEGPQYKWDSSGNIKSEENYKDGKLEGFQYYGYDSYYDDYGGKIEEIYEKEVNYKYGKKEGAQYSWYKSGNIESKLFYKNDKLNGTQYYYNDNEDNTVYLEENYKNGLLDGTKYYYNKDGIVELKEIYKNGIQIR